MIKLHVLHKAAMIQILQGILLIASVLCFFRFFFTQFLEIHLSKFPTLTYFYFWPGQRMFHFAVTQLKYICIFNFNIRDLLIYLKQYSLNSLVKLSLQTFLIIKKTFTLFFLQTFEVLILTKLGIKITITMFPLKVLVIMLYLEKC